MFIFKNKMFLIIKIGKLCDKESYEDKHFYISHHANKVGKVILFFYENT